MIKIFLSLIVALVLTVPSYTVAEETKKIDGYMWEELPISFKTTYLSGYLRGFSAGSSSGTFERLVSLKEFIIIMKDEKYFKEIEGIFNLHLALSVSDAVMFDKNNTDYYIKELESFYKTYPLCKSSDFLGLIRKLTDVWGNKPKENSLTYKDVGEDCLNPNNKKSDKEK
jgi:hypothetical protein